MSTVIDGCGVAEHDEFCLCDVVITKPLPPLNECFRDAVAEMWMGKELCELKDYGVPWDNESILNYLSDLKTFYDEFHNNPITLELPKEQIDIVPLVKEYREQNAQWNLRVRNAVQYHMDNHNESICSILESLGLTPQIFIDSATAYNGGEWDWERLALLDKMFSEHVFVLTRISNTVGCNIDVVKGLKKYWVPRRMRQGQGNNPARQLLGKLSVDPECAHMSTRDICIIVEREYGVHYTNSAVSKIRNRTKRRQ